MEPKQDNKSSITPSCVGCVIWEKFGKNCFYHWEDKKECSMFASDWDDVSKQKE